MTAEELQRTAQQEQENERKFHYQVRVCTAAGCLSAGAGEVRQALEQELAERGMRSVCQIKGVGCMGLCSAGPLVSIEPEGWLCGRVTPDDAADVLRSLVEGRPVRRLAVPTDLPFFRSQMKIVLENSGRVDPGRIEDYIAAGGYSAALKALSEMTPQEVVREVDASGLRGRGGAGYPTGLKWSTVAKGAGPEKYVVANADEGDPGAFMDRAVLESDPHRVLEGMIVAAYAVGAQRGFVYVRAEYPLAVERLRRAIRQAERTGLLGHRIGGTEFSFGVEVRLGAGAFVCGEETALMASIEGRRGTPRPRPPYPAESGLWGHSTLINNVETLANIPPIILRGGQWFAGIGTARSKGTKVFALAGRVVNTGLIEVPMGTSLRQIIYEIGGGVPEGRRLKAVQTGGPSGGCIPEEYLDTPVDYESLTELGSMMGSGGMIVMDETTCMVDVARFFLDFSRGESCGKCVPCRVGTAHLYELLDRIVRGRGDGESLQKLEELSDLLRHTSLCGLGQSAPNPVLSTLRYFRQEYEAHLRDGRCLAGSCRGHGAQR